MSFGRDLYIPKLTDQAETATKEEGREPPAMISQEVVALGEEQPLNPYTEIQILSHHTDTTIRLLTKIDHMRCASAGDDCKVNIWDIVIGCQLHCLEGHTRPVTCMCVLHHYEDETDPDEEAVAATTLITAASDKLICIWDIDTGICRKTLSDNVGPIRCLLPLEEQELFCAGGESICLWDHSGQLHSAHVHNEVEDIYKMLVMRKDHLITVADTDLDVSLRVVFKGVEYNSHIPHPYIPLEMRPRTRIPILNMQLFIVKEGEESEIAFSIQHHKPLDPHRESILSLVKINDDCFATGSLDGMICVWRLPDLKCSFTFNRQSVDDYRGANRLYPFSIQHMLCVSQRYLFATIGAGFKVYDALAHKLVAECLHAHHSKILHLAFVYNGAFLATCSEDGSIRLWSCNKNMYHNEDEEENQEDQEDVFQGYLDIEKFFGKKEEDLRKQKEIIQPDLVGECLAHSGAVQMCVDFDGDGFVSCGMDGLLIAWKDGIRQSQRRNEIIRGMLAGETVGAL